MYEISVQDHFDAAHKLDDYVGACRNLHGHRWDVKVTFRGEGLDKINMLIDFTDVKRVMKELLSKEGRLDHHFLNESLSDKRYVSNPTAEYLASWIYGQIKCYWNQGELSLCPSSVTVFESPECGVTYSE